MIWYCIIAWSKSLKFYDQTHMSKRKGKFTLCFTASRVLETNWQQSDRKSIFNSLTPYRPAKCEYNVFCFPLSIHWLQTQPQSSQPTSSILGIIVSDIISDGLNQAKQHLQSQVLFQISLSLLNSNFPSGSLLTLSTFIENNYLKQIFNYHQTSSTRTWKSLWYFLFWPNLTHWFNVKTMSSAQSTTSQVYKIVSGE